MNRKGFYPRSRGIFDYIGIYSDAAWKLYDWLLGHADWKDPERYGQIDVKIVDLAKALRKHPQTIKRCIRELHYGYTIGRKEDLAPPFIKVIKVSGKTNSQVITIQILKVKLKPQDFKKNHKADDPFVIPDEANKETIAYYKTMAKKLRDKRKLPEWGKE